MYSLSEQQIERILNDIRARGVKTESLQLNLLDHICCIVERELEPDGDFESFYQQTLKTFYRHRLSEIEEEAELLLTYKNYYTMKKAMIISGGLSALLLTVGIFFKFMHWPGASINLVCGITMFSLMFLPLVFLLKVRENTVLRDRIIYALGTVAAMLFSMAILFKIMYWPGANVMGVSVVVLMGCVFLPIYFVSGIRNAETKLNTIVTSVLVVAGCGLFLSLVRIPAKTHQQHVTDTRNYVRTQRILETEQRQLQYDNKGAVFTVANSKAVNDLCEQLKAYLIERETGQAAIPYNFNPETTVLTETWANVYFPEEGEATNNFTKLRKAVADYNKAVAAGNGLSPIPVEGTVLEDDNVRVTNMLTDLIQVQMVLVQNEREQLATL